MSKLMKRVVRYGPAVLASAYVYQTDGLGTAIATGIIVLIATVILMVPFLIVGKFVSDARTKKLGNRALVEQGVDLSAVRPDAKAAKSRDRKARKKARRDRQWWFMRPLGWAIAAVWFFGVGKWSGLFDNDFAWAGVPLGAVVMSLVVSPVLVPYLLLRLVGNDTSPFVRDPAGRQLQDEMYAYLDAERRKGRKISERTALAHVLWTKTEEGQAVARLEKAQSEDLRRKYTRHRGLST